MLHLKLSTPDHPDAQPLLVALSATLKQITGADGTTSFGIWHAEACAAFVLAYEGAHAVGCGAIRPLDATSAEVKRMYASLPGQGIGAFVLAGLETLAADFGYKRVLLETRRVNAAACSFYLAKGYRETENYGRYKGRAECVCFAKEL